MNLMSWSLLAALWLCTVLSPALLLALLVLCLLALLDIWWPWLPLWCGLLGVLPGIAWAEIIRRRTGLLPFYAHLLHMPQLLRSEADERHRS